MPVERLDKLRQQLDVIRHLMASHYGLTLEEIEEALECKRRTAQRFLRVLEELYSDRFVKTQREDRRLAWRIAPAPRGQPDLPASEVTLEEAQELALAERELAERGLKERARILRALQDKLRLLMAEQARRRLEVDIEALMEGEGLVSRPGPRAALDEHVLPSLREALLKNRRIRLTYRTPGKAVRTHLLEPVGVLYGLRPYLLAIKPGRPDTAVWRLDRVDRVEVTDEGFTRGEGQDLASMTADCFGIWREAPVDVELRFTPSAAEDARQWRFHASQRVTEEADGHLRVRFRAGGIEEMAMHLITWGDAVEVLAPERLRQRMAEIGQGLVARYGGKAAGP